MRSLRRSQAAQLKRVALESKRNVLIEGTRSVMERVFLNVSAVEQVSVTVRVTHREAEGGENRRRVGQGSDWTYKANKS